MGRKKEKKVLVTRQTMLGELLEKYPPVAEFLAEKYKLFCVACFGAAFDTIEGGAMIHGMDDEQIDKMVEDLNKFIASLDKTSSGEDKGKKKRDKGN